MHVAAPGDLSEEGRGREQLYDRKNKAGSEERRRATSRCVLQLLEKARAAAPSPAV